MEPVESKKLEKILKKYAHRCPKCDAYHPGIWRVCTSCHTPLINSKIAFALGLLKKIALFFVIVGAVIYLAYYIQFFQSDTYRKSRDYLLRGNFTGIAQELSSGFVTGIYKPITKALKKAVSKAENPRKKVEAKKHGKQTPTRSVTEFTPTGKITRYEYGEAKERAGGRDSTTPDHSTDPVDALKGAFRGIGFQSPDQLSGADMTELDQCGAGVMAYGAFNTFGTSLGNMIRMLQRVPGENGSQSHLYVKKDNHYVVLRFLTNSPEDPKDFHFRVDWTSRVAVLEEASVGNEDIGEIYGGMALRSILESASNR